MSAIRVEIKRHDLKRAEIIADLYVDGVLALADTNLVGEGVDNFDVFRAGGPADLRARASRRAKATPEWRAREVTRVTAAYPITFGLGGVLP